MKKYTKIRVILFKNYKHVFKLIYQTGPKKLVLWNIQKLVEYSGDVPISGHDLEEKENATPTNAESQKKQLRCSNRIKAL